MYDYSDEYVHVEKLLKRNVVNIFINYSSLWVVQSWYGINIYFPFVFLDYQTFLYYTFITFIIQNNFK